MAASCGVPLCHSPRGRLSIISLSAFLTLILVFFLALSITTTTTKQPTLSSTRDRLDFKKTHIRETLPAKGISFENMQARDVPLTKTDILKQRRRVLNGNALQQGEQGGSFLGETPVDGDESSVRQADDGLRLPPSPSSSSLLPPPLSSNLISRPHPTNTTLPKRQRYPQALIIGVRKGGTRALINMLRCHPDIVAAVEEIHFYDRNENFKQGIQWYVEQMPPSTEQQITIEKSPFYFVSPSTPKRVHDISPDIKIILIVRNPIDRAMSDYNQLTRKRSNRGSFENFVFPPSSGQINTNCSPISASCYDVHFKKWLKYFSRDQIHIVDGDTLISNPAPEVKGVESFLGVSSYFTEDMFYFNATKGFYCWTKLDRHKRVVPDCLGSEKGHAMPQLSNHTVQRLASFFRPHNERFFLQIGRRFNWDTKYRNTVYT